MGAYRRLLKEDRIPRAGEVLQLAKEYEPGATGRANAETAAVVPESIGLEGTPATGAHRAGMVAALRAVKATAKTIAMGATLMLGINIASVFGASAAFAQTSGGKQQGTPLYNDHAAGYVAGSDLKSPKPVVTSVEGSWIMQDVETKGFYSTDLVAWIGIGSYLSEKDTTLIQVGSQSEVKDGRKVFSFWYELIPDTMKTIMSSTSRISPGDTIKARISLVEGTSNRWLIKVEDITTKYKYSNTVTYESSKQSAEWVLERPTNYINHQRSTYLNPVVGNGTVRFGFAGMDNMATIGSVRGKISAFANRPLVMLQQAWGGPKAVAEPTAIKGDSSGFSITYHSALR